MHKDNARYRLRADNGHFSLLWIDNLILALSVATYGFQQTSVFQFVYQISCGGYRIVCNGSNIRAAKNRIRPHLGIYCQGLVYRSFTCDKLPNRNINRNPNRNFLRGN